MNYKFQQKITLMTVLLVLCIVFYMSSAMHIFYYCFGLGAVTKASLVCCFVYLNFFRIFYSVQFILACLAVRIRFKAFNQSLTLCLTQSKCGHEGDVEAVAFDDLSISKSTKIFHSLSDAIEIINGTFTFHLVIIISILLVRIESSILVRPTHWIRFTSQVRSIFASYGLVNEILRPTKLRVVTLFLNCQGFSHHFLLTIFIIHFGSSTTREAEEAVVALSKMTNRSELSESQKNDFVYCMTQVKSRCLSIQNFLFKIDWNVLLAVSFDGIVRNCFIVLIVFQITSTIVTYLVITCQIEST